MQNLGGYGDDDDDDEEEEDESEVDDAADNDGWLKKQKQRGKDETKESK